MTTPYYHLSLYHKIPTVSTEFEDASSLERTGLYSLVLDHVYPLISKCRKMGLITRKESEAYSKFDKMPFWP